MNRRLCFLLTGVGPNPSRKFIDTFFSISSDVIVILAGTNVNIFYHEPRLMIIRVAKNDCMAYQQDIQNIVRLYQVTDIVPLIDSEVNFLSNNRMYFDSINVRLWINRFKDPSQYIDKEKTYKNARRFSPKFELIYDPNFLMEALCKLGYPTCKVAARPSSGPNGSGKGFRIIDSMSTLWRETFYNSTPSRSITAEDYHRYMVFAKSQNLLPPILLSEYLPGPEYSCYVLCDNGMMEICAIHEKMEYEEGTTNSGVARLTHDEAIKDCCRHLCLELQLDLINNIQLKLDSMGSPLLIEVNPRIAGTIMLSEKSGYSLIQSCFNLMHGKRALTEYKIINDYEFRRDQSERFTLVSEGKLRCVYQQNTEDYLVKHIDIDATGRLLQYETVVFDLDNTLLDELHFLRHSVIDFMNQFAIDRRVCDYILETLNYCYKKFGNDGIYDRVLEKYFGREQLESFLNILKQQRGKNSVRFLDRREKLLDELCKNNISIYLLTDGNRLQQASKIMMAGLSKYIPEDKIYYAADYGGKPSEGCRIKLSVCQQPKAVFVGDSSVDLHMAKKLGIDYVRLLD